MKIMCIQIDYIIGHIDDNCAKIEDAVQTHSKDADLLVFSELSITGYPPMDLLENRKLVDDNLEGARRVAALSTASCALIFGFVDRDQKGLLYNAAAFASNGKIELVQHKKLLPTYDVFDEHRYFTPARKHGTVEYMGHNIGMTICEDIWNFSQSTTRYTDHRWYEDDPVSSLMDEGMDMLINISASPYVSGKNRHKHSFLSDISRQCGIPVVYCNQIGGNDSLIFDGFSQVYNSDGKLTAAAPKFKEGSCIFSPDMGVMAYPEEDEMEDLEAALCLGLRDYVTKCGFSSTVIGLSGGIDSALTAALAVKALGADNVRGITMPSVYSSSGSVDDSVELAANLGIRIDEIPIRDIFDRFNTSLAPLFSGLAEDVTEENLQARIRGTLLMAASNKFGSMVLTTGNKSELAMGYCTLYGDMNGGLAVISDLPKSTVYKLARYMNRDGVVIPVNTIEKPPSAELREGQKDEDSLPPYDILDGILREYVENKKCRAEITAMGYDKETVDFIVKAVDRNEYKRRQAAPGLKVTSKAFGTGRRIPMAQRFRP